MDKFKGKYRTGSNRLPRWDYSKNGYYYITVVSYDRKCIFGEIQNKKMIFSDLGKMVFEEWHKSFKIRQELVLDEFILMPNHLHAIVILFDQDNRNNDVRNIDIRNVDVRNVDVRNNDIRNVETDGRLSLRTNSDPNPNPDPDSNSDPNSDPDPNPNPNPNPNPDPDSDPDPNSDSDPNPIPIPNPDPNSDPNHYIPIRKPKSISSFVAGFKSVVVTKMDNHIDDQKLSMPKYNRKNPLWQANYHDHIIRNDGEYHRIKKYIIHNPGNWDEDSFR